MVKIEPFILEKQCELVPSAPVLVGVSGGADSMYLWLALMESGYSVIVAHFDHQLRHESAEDAAWVQEQAENRGCLFVLGRADVAALVKEKRGSLEEVARDARYRFLFETAERLHCQAVAVGHTADDQVETVLLHLLRGSGLNGLSGMRYRSFLEAYSTEIPLVRPLLGTWRQDIERSLRMQEISYRQDSSNFDLTFLRNRIRHILLPHLETYNPQIRRLLWQTAFLLQMDEQIIEEAVATAWERCVVEHRGDLVIFSTACFFIESDAIQRRLLWRAAILCSSDKRGSDFQSIERAWHFLRGRSPGVVELQGKVQVVLDAEHIYVAKLGQIPVSANWPAVQRGASIYLEIPGRVDLEKGWCLEASVIENSFVNWNQLEKNPYEVYLDGEKLQSPLMVRSRQPGDRFWPLGMANGPMRLSDFMVNAHIPRPARDTWPLVFSADALVWVVGVRLAHPFRITQNTRKIVRLRLLRRSG
jgi:tRNA(Ile)-lysidine synthase